MPVACLDCLCGCLVVVFTFNGCNLVVTHSTCLHHPISHHPPPQTEEGPFLAVHHSPTRSRSVKLQTDNLLLGMIHSTSIPPRSPLPTSAGVCQSRNKVIEVSDRCLPVCAPVLRRLRLEQVVVHGLSLNPRIQGLGPGLDMGMGTRTWRLQNL
jgi:hypothetical protein